MIAIHYLYYLIFTVCLYMEVNYLNYMIKKCKVYICRIEKGNKKNLDISHCRLLPYINDCNYIDSILERRCIRILYNIFNSENRLYS